MAQGANQIRGQRIGGRLAAANDHIGQQRQPKRVAMGQFHQLLLPGGVHATGLQILPALLRAQVAQRHHPQQLPPGRVSAPGRIRRCPSGDDRQGGGRQARQQPRGAPSHPTDSAAHRCRTGPPTGRCRTVRRWRPPPGHLKQPPAPVARRRRRDEVAPSNEPPLRLCHRPARRGRPEGLTCRCLVVRGCGATETEGRATPAPAEQLDLGCAADKRGRRRAANSSPSVPADPISVIAAG